MDRRLSRREFLLASSATLLAPALVVGEENKPFTLPKLPYAYDALEPHIDARTMEIHHDRHHKAYVDNLNKALAGQTDLLGKSLSELLAHSERLPESIRQAVINNGGGHANHSLFWEIMAPKAGGSPKGELARAIERDFGSFDKFQTKLSEAALTRFGSGWAWLALDNGKLMVFSSSNQDSPLMKGQTPLLGIDVWEHAYYLKYQNQRASYIKAWWNVVNWNHVAEQYSKLGKKGS